MYREQLNKARYCKDVEVTVRSLLDSEEQCGAYREAAEKRVQVVMFAAELVGTKYDSVMKCDGEFYFGNLGVVEFEAEVYADDNVADFSIVMRCGGYVEEKQWHMDRTADTDNFITTGDIFTSYIAQALYDRM